MSQAGIRQAERLVHRWSVSEGRQIWQGKGNSKVVRTQAKSMTRKHLGNDMDQSWDVSVQRQENELATNTRNTGTINTQTHYHQVKQIREETGNQGSGWNQTSRNEVQGKRGREINRQKKQVSKSRHRTLGEPSGIWGAWVLQLLDSPPLRQEKGQQSVEPTYEIRPSEDDP